MSTETSSEISAHLFLPVCSSSLATVGCIKRVGMCQVLLVPVESKMKLLPSLIPGQTSFWTPCQSAEQSTLYPHLRHASSLMQPRLPHLGFYPSSFHPRPPFPLTLEMSWAGKFFCAYMELCFLPVPITQYACVYTGLSLI